MGVAGNNIHPNLIILAQYVVVGSKKAGNENILKTICKMDRFWVGNYKNDYFIFSVFKALTIKTFLIKSIFKF